MLLLLPLLLVLVLGLKLLRLLVLLLLRMLPLLLLLLQPPWLCRLLLPCCLALATARWPWLWFLSALSRLLLMWLLPVVPFPS